MRGVVADGIYRATIGRIVVVGDTPIGREMGMSTSIVIFGTNDRAFAQADMIVNPDELQRVLKALRGRDFTVASIRKHAVGDIPSPSSSRRGNRRQRSSWHGAFGSRSTSKWVPRKSR